MMAELSFLDELSLQWHKLPHYFRALGETLHAKCLSMQIWLELQHKKCGKQKYDCDDGGFSDGSKVLIHKADGTRQYAVILGKMGFGSRVMYYCKILPLNACFNLWVTAYLQIITQTLVVSRIFVCHCQQNKGIFVCC